MVPAVGRSTRYVSSLRVLCAAAVFGLVTPGRPTITNEDALQPATALPLAAPASLTAPVLPNERRDSNRSAAAEQRPPDSDATGPLSSSQPNSSQVGQPVNRTSANESLALSQLTKITAIEAARDRAVSQLLLITCLIGVAVAFMLTYYPDVPWSWLDAEYWSRAGDLIQRTKACCACSWLSEKAEREKKEREGREGCKASMAMAMFSVLCFSGAILVGVMSPLQATINAMVAEPYGSPLLASTLCQDIELVLLVPLALVLFNAQSTAYPDSELRAWMFAGGPLGGFYVVSLTVLRTMLAVEVTFVAVNLGQLLAATGMDQIGFAGLRKRPLTRRRALAIAVNIAACVVLQINVSGGPPTPIRDKGGHQGDAQVVALGGATGLNALLGPTGPADWSVALLTAISGQSLDAFAASGVNPTNMMATANSRPGDQPSADAEADPADEVRHARMQARAMAELNKADSDESPFTWGTLVCVLWAMLAGASATVQTCVNTRLAAHIRGPWRALLMCAAISTSMLALFYLWQRLATGREAAISALPWELPPWQTVGGGLLGIFCAAFPVILTPILGVATIYVVVLFGQLCTSMIWQLVVAGMAGTLEPAVLIRCFAAGILSFIGSWLVRDPDK